MGFIGRRTVGLNVSEELSGSQKVNFDKPPLENFPLEVIVAGCGSDCSNCYELWLKIQQLFWIAGESGKK